MITRPISVAHVAIPAVPKGATGNLQYGSGKTYAVTATFPDGRSCSARFAYGTPADEVEKKWAKAVATIPKSAKPVPAEERNKPASEPFLTEWLALHKQHLKALREGRKDPLRLCDAVSLADAKYAVYRREHAARFPMFATTTPDFAAHRRETESTARETAKGLRKAGVKANARKGAVRVTAKGKK